MKQIFLFIFCFGIITTIKAQLLSVKYTDLGSFIHDEINFWYWEEWAKDTYIYNSSCNLESQIRQYKSDNGSWNDGSRMIYYYNTNNKNNQVLDQQWNSDSKTWNNSYQQLHDYDEFGRLKTTTSMKWINNNWENATRTAKSYNEDNQLDAILSEEWHNNSWKKLFITNNYYTNNTLSKIIELRRNGSIWDSARRSAYTYGADGKPLAILTERWQNDHWENDELKTYTYVNIFYYTYTLLTQRWNGGWTNVTLESVVNNSMSGNPIEWTTQSWDPFFSWRNNTREIYSFGNSCTLPLDLLAFDAEKNDNDVMLHWHTANEINTSHFTIERSLDGINFKPVDSIKAISSGITNNYSYTDNIAGIKTHTLYYRLKIMDKDGTTDISKVLKIKIEPSKNTFTIKPNPAKNNFILFSDASNITKAVVHVTDITGRTILQIKPTGNETKINIQALSLGVYFVRIQINGTMVQRKLLVQ